MRIQYFTPGDDIREFISSYYAAEFPAPLSDVMRAEIASVRFIIKGHVTNDLSGTPVEVPPGAAILCGPTQKASRVSFSKGCTIFGAAVTPQGWARMFDVDASALADRVAPLFQHATTSEQRELIVRILKANRDELRITLCDELFGAMVDRDKPVNEHFLEEVTAWITSEEEDELADLLDRLDISPRQVERLSKRYFGCPPKLLHRKFRALNSANRLSWEDLSDWRDAASGDYYDHSHFINEFKHFNGRTPNEFINGPHLLVRKTLQERLEIVHGSPFSLIG